MPHRRASSFHAVRIVGLALALLLAGCAVKLAPDYDRTIVDGLSGANTRTMTLFASVSAGTDAASFPAREGTYNSVIGEFEALRMQALARPAPQPWIAGFFDFGTPDNPEAVEKFTEAPTPAIIETISETLTRMRDVDRAQGLSPDMIEGFKNSYEISIDQALTYEKALER